MSMIVSVSVRALLKEYGWRHVAVIYDEQEVFYKNAGPSMIEDFKHDPDFPDPYELKFNRTDNWLPEETMEDASAHARGIRK
ncbi:hypothetical protein DPMN_018073 [Dreissena polymorpha]|uniref:Uncharacterized protein n=1 Tax=Dreissena polymorpha TaxID=45954 RepID=A0A9D4NGK7_DREPO|nr:hypothetical protein DPMN_018073 [Dreissena polymorpha]